MQNGRWEPWNPVVEVVLKPILNSVPMYVKKVEWLNVPKPGEEAGYDLVAGDWVAPHGKGSVSDFIFKIDSRDLPAATQRKDVNPGEYYEIALTLRFSNESDGVQLVMTPPRLEMAVRYRSVATSIVCASESTGEDRSPGRAIGVAAGVFSGDGAVSGVCGTVEAGACWSACCGGSGVSPICRRKYS